MNPNLTLNEIRKQIRKTLAGSYDENEIRNFIDLIFHHLLNYSKIDIRLKGNEMISQHHAGAVEKILKRLIHFEPIQYILGETVFFDMTLLVSRDVLIPRPETEELVDWIIRENRGKPVRILDVGTGSGCIALALARNLPLATITGVDISEKALEIARKNATMNEVQVSFYPVDILNLCVGFSDNFNILVSNPPYVRESEIKYMHSNVLKYEPHEALFVSNDDPLLFYKAIADLGRNILLPGGLIYCEINEALPEETMHVFHSRDYKVVEMRCDINDKPRMIKAGKQN
ncbi:MAG: peptide chain release factor N(5)-glutamine methyltransferase [Bacteroidales bacterium]|nr:peptide chain release factor N(5)-glutamine methyltransferase [Bacteroidales bacterium]